MPGIKKLLAYILVMIAISAALTVWAQSESETTNTIEMVTSEYGGEFSPKGLRGTIDAGSLECTGNPLDCEKIPYPVTGGGGETESCAKFYRRSDND